MKQAELFNLFDSYLNLMIRIEAKAVIQSQIDDKNTSVIDPMLRELEGIANRIGDILDSEEITPMQSYIGVKVMNAHFELSMIRANLRQAFYASRD